MKVVLVHVAHGTHCRVLTLLEKIPGMEIVEQTNAFGIIPEICFTRNPDLLIIETQGEDTAALKMIMLLKRICPDIKVFAIVGGAEDDMLQSAKEAGADVVARSDLTVDEAIMLVHCLKKQYRAFPRIDPV